MASITRFGMKCPKTSLLTLPRRGSGIPLARSTPSLRTQNSLYGANRRANYSSKPSGSESASGGIYIPTWLFKVAIPSALLVYGLLYIFERESRRSGHGESQRSGHIRQWLFNENKRIGRSEGCQEIHESDIDKWIEENPEHATHWKHVKKHFKKD